MKLHQQALDNIIRFPSIINLPDPLSAEIEVPFYEHKRLVGQADIVFEYLYAMTIIEYKSHDTHQSRVRALCQLLNAREGLKKQYKKPINQLLYVHDDFQVEEIRWPKI